MKKLVEELVEKYEIIIDPMVLLPAESVKSITKCAIRETARRCCEEMTLSQDDRFMVVKKAPSIEELEKILHSDNTPAIEILPNGELKTIKTWNEAVEELEKRKEKVI